jgi:serine/threonine-protein kinase
VEIAIDGLPPELAQRFTVVEPFARGDCGTLYLADEPSTGRRGILKVLHPVAAAHAADRQRVKRELVKQATLSHANLVTPTATGEAGATTWVFREWLEGVSLAVRLARSGPLQPPEALSIAAQLASALDELHRAGLLHRDLKPGHVLLAPQPNGLSRAYVIDAGIGAYLPDTGTAFDVLGTAAYVSPEQAAGKLVSFRSDLYALGCVLYEMLTGKPPFTGDTPSVLAAHGKEPLPPLPTHVPSGVQTLLGQLLAKEPRERPFSAQQVRRALEPFLPEAAPTTVSRESTRAFDTLGSGLPAPSGRPEAHTASGTLRPPQPGAPPVGAALAGTAVGTPAPPTAAEEGVARNAPKKTIIGMPVVLPPAPPPPGPQSASRPPPPPPPPASGGPEYVVQSRPPPPPPPASGGPEYVVQSRPPPPPPPGVVPPDPRAPDLQPARTPPVAAAHVQPAPASQTEELSPLDVEQAESVLAEAAAPQGLDYDEDAETRALDAQAAMARGPAAQTEAAPRAPATPEVAARPSVGPEERRGSEVSHPTRPGAHASLAADAAPALRQPLQTARTKNKVGFIVLFTLLGFCGVSLVGIGGGLWYLERYVERRLAELGADARRPGTRPTDTQTHEGMRDVQAQPPTSGAPTVVDTSTSAGSTPGNLAAVETSPTPPSRPAFRTVHVTTSPPGALIRLNGTAVCTAPCDVEVSRGGPSTLRAERDGHEASEKVLDDAWLERFDAVSFQLNPVPPARPLTTGHGAVAAGDDPGARISGTGGRGGGSGSGAGGATAATSSSTGGASSGRGRETRAGSGGTTAAASGASSGRGRETGAGSGGTTAAASGASGSGGTGATPFDTLREQAREHFAAGRYREAAAAYERAVALNPNHAGAFAGLGASRLRLGDARGAVAAYEKATQLNPQNASFFVALGNAQLAAGDRNGARQSFLRALSLDPNHGAARQGLAQLGG